MRWMLLAAVLTVCCSPTALWALSGRDLVLNSSGSTSGSAAQLAGSGYVGTYITVPNAGDGGSTVHLTISANRVSGGSGDDPHMNIVVADSKFGYTLSNTSAMDFSTGDMWLPTGTYFVRLERDSAGNPSSSTRTAQINSLAVSGASLANYQSDANALAAANTYIDNFRRGPAAVTLRGAAPGSEVHVKLQRHDFNFGTIARGFNSFPDLADNPTPGSGAYHYQQFVNGRFNSLVPSNGGKWAHNEWTRDAVTMAGIDDFLDYAAAHDMRARMHNLIWDTGQQPDWVRNDGGTGLLDRAAAGDTAAKEELRQEILERIDYYVRDRASQYSEIDVVNESLHQPRYWQVFGASGFAEFFNEVTSAIDDAGSDARAMLNEYNVLQWSQDPLNPGTSDPYANWYRDHAVEIMEAGGAMSGIGAQYYADSRTSSDGLGSAAHSAGRILQAYQNLSVTGLPIALTEFGVGTGNAATYDWGWTSQIMEDAMRMTFGTADATSFLIWDIISTGDTDFGMFDSDYLNPTSATTRWDALMDEWDTDLTLPVNADGTIDFTGFYGDYEITTGGQTFTLSIAKGTTGYSLVVGPFVPGDYNGDGTVDAADYSVWRDAMAAGANSLLNEDASPGIVDEADYAVWRTHFGETAGSGTIAPRAAPEPTSLLLWAAMIAGWFAGRRG